jgi:DNA-binding response OmpR family regulator
MSSGAPVARILIVEDDPTIALGLRMLLYDWGYDVMAVAASGEHALILAAAEQPDLVLMDVRLAGRMDGIDTAAVLRLKHTMPILFLTAQSDARTVEQLSTSGADGVLFKPVDPPRLRSAVAEVLTRAGIATPAPADTPAEPTEASLR